MRRKPYKSSEPKVEIQMTPMLDMIFQLLVFFILTFQPVVDEGEFDVTMSNVRGGAKATPGEVKSASPSVADYPADLPIGLRLHAAADGSLAQGGIEMGERILADMAELQSALLSLVVNQGEECELVIEADTSLEYQYVVQAINAMSHAGIKRINFAPARPDET